VWPASLDPAYVRALVSFDASEQPQRWQGGFSHCGDVNTALAEELSHLSGQPQREGECNVEWVRVTGVGHSHVVLSGTASVLMHARIVLYEDSVRMARHEIGHILGLKHSPRASDLMAVTPIAETFSADELAVVAAIYGRDQR
jgi:hypothetical protein